MSKIDLIEARLMVANADKDKARARKATKKDKENERAPGKGNGKKEEKKGAGKKKRSAPAVQWSKPEFFYLSDALLTIIEGKARYRQAFGFDKGQSGPVDTGGKKIPELCSDVAQELFINDQPETVYISDDLPTLAGVVKNRIVTLKTKYQEHHGQLGATGHGLVTSDRAAEIIEGSDIGNAWDAITKKFPWYMRMDALMGTSPIVNRSAVAHSQTRVNLSVLDRGGEAHDGPISVDSDDDTDSKLSNWSVSPARAPPTGHAARIKNESSDDEDDTLSPSLSPRRAAAVPTTPAPKIKVKAEDQTPVLSARGSKRKSMHDHIQELTAQDRSQRIKLTELKEKEKTARAQAKYDAKNDLEMARLKHQQREAERQRAHELLMFERQMQLETLHRAPPAPTMGAYGAGAPAYGAPPPEAMFDPRLM